MTLVADVAAVIAGVLALWFGARWLVAGATTIARATGVSSLVVGLTVVAFGTSAPEIAVSAGAAIEGQADVAVGNVLGSNVFNLAFILGVVATLRPFRVSTKLVRRDAVAMAATTVVGIAVLADLAVSRIEGASLLALFVAYLGWIWRTGTGSPADPPDGRRGEELTPVAAGEIDRGARRYGVELARLLVGLGLVLVGGRLLVGGATAIALSIGVSEWAVGVTIVAAGTSLPELATSIVAVRRGNLDIAAGNVVGSNVFNLLVVLGGAAVFAPLTVDAAVLSGLAWLAVVTGLTASVLATGRRLTRIEGLALVAIGASYWAWTVL